MKELLSQYGRLFRITVGVVLFLWVVITFSSPSLSVYADLPPRPEPEPTVESTLEGGQIKLIVTDPAGGEWTEIEWQDPATGDWHRVDGWRGHMVADGSASVQVWWVGSDQFGRGPFRWLVYDAEGGDLMVTSDSFEMPANNENVTIVVVAINGE